CPWKSRAKKVTSLRRKNSLKARTKKIVAQTGGAVGAFPLVGAEALVVEDVVAPITEAMMVDSSIAEVAVVEDAVIFNEGVGRIAAT
ncbi:hypothetical protein T265_12394, partial [Opisthorchis viverrini]